MKKFSGKSVLQGIAVGKIYVYHKTDVTPEKKSIQNPEEEILRFREAKEKAEEQLDQLYETALKETGEEQALIFDIHKMMLNDADFLEQIPEYIKEQKVNAEYAVMVVGQQLADVFASMDDAYMKERFADILDISKRLIRILMGVGEGGIDSKDPVILLAEDLSPSETMQMDKNKILAFVTAGGSVNSHTAILARSLNLPSLVNTGMEILQEYHGKPAVVDGFTGTFLVDPENDILEEMINKKNKWVEDRKLLLALKGKENITKDGKTIKVFANVGNLQDVDKALENDAGGIGLFRSEFIYLGRENYPTEEEQFEIYKEAAIKMQGKKVIIRTLDIGADKQADYFNIPAEENPAMGYRAIRICLSRPEIFKTQLRAIYRASAFGTISIMFPMIISLWEIRKIKEIIQEVKEELTRENHAMGQVEMGIMIETPAAVMISDELAAEVDFFSIGTNDLTQYTLAIDRQNQNLDMFYDSHHPAVLKMIRTTVENGHKAGIWVGICGELASDTSLTEQFLKMGVDELSVSPVYVLELRKTIRNL